MAVTKIENIVVPEVFIPYVAERTAALSALIQAGIVVPDPSLDILAQAGGKIIEMPFFQDLTGDDEILSETSPLTAGNITAVKDVARLHMRGRAWGATDLAKALSGDDPMAAIANLVAAYWNRREQALLISTLTGVFADNAANDSGDLVSDISVADGGTVLDSHLIGPNGILDAAAKLGDAAGKLTALAMHSVCYTRLQKLNLIDFVPDSEGKVNIPTYMGKRVIVDDGCPAVAVSPNYEYTTYLFGAGAIGRGEGSAPVPVETDRDSLQGQDYLIHRRHFILHPRGIKWGEVSIAGVSPTNAECEEAQQWDRVYEKKNIRLVKLITNG
jgi:hypothetical protein